MIFDRSHLFELPYYTFDGAESIYDETRPIDAVKFWKDFLETPLFQKMHESRKCNATVSPVTFLELGCGTGRLATPLCKLLLEEAEIPFQFFAVDASIEMLKIFYEKAAKGCLLKSVFFYLGDARDLQSCRQVIFSSDMSGVSYEIQQAQTVPFDKGVDFCIVNWLFHVVGEWQDVIWEIKKILGETGYLIGVFEKSDFYDEAIGGKEICVGCSNNTFTHKTMEEYHRLRNLFIKYPPGNKRIGQFIEEINVSNFLKEISMEPFEKINKSPCEMSTTPPNVMTIIQNKAFSNMSVVPDNLNKEIIENLNGIRGRTADSKQGFFLSGNIYKIKTNIPQDIILQYIKHKVEQSFKNLLLYHHNSEKFKDKIKDCLGGTLRYLFDEKKQVLYPDLFKKVKWVYTRYFGEFATGGMEISGPIFSSLTDDEETMFKIALEVYRYEYKSKTETIDRSKYTFAKYLFNESQRKRSIGIGYPPDGNNPFLLNEISIKKDLIKMLNTGYEIFKDNIINYSCAIDIPGFCGKQRDAIKNTLTNPTWKPQVEKFCREFSYALKLSDLISGEDAAQLIQNFFIFPGNVYYLFPALIWEVKAGGITIGINGRLELEEFNLLQNISDELFIKQRIREKNIAAITRFSELAKDEQREVIGNFLAWWGKFKHHLQQSMGNYNRVNNPYIKESFQEKCIEWFTNMLADFFLTPIRREKQDLYYVQIKEIENLFDNIDKLLENAWKLSRAKLEEELQAVYDEFTSPLKSVIDTLLHLWGGLKGALVYDKYPENLPQIMKGYEDFRFNHFYIDDLVKDKLTGYNLVLVVVNFYNPEVEEIIKNMLKEANILVEFVVGK